MHLHEYCLHLLCLHYATGRAWGSFWLAERAQGLGRARAPPRAGLRRGGGEAADPPIWPTRKPMGAPGTAAERLKFMQKVWEGGAENPGSGCPDPAGRASRSSSPESWASPELEPKRPRHDPGMNATGNNSLLPRCINYGFINIPAVPPC